MADDNKPIQYMRYAIGEIILVVIGILIALQLNSWKENSTKRFKEKEILQDIHEEFIQNKIQLEKVVFKHKLSSDNCKKIIQLLPINLPSASIDSLEYLCD